MACCCVAALATLCCYSLALVLLFVAVHYLLSRIPLSSLSSRPVLITGCDSGFGYYLALRLLNNGVPVFAACMSDKGMEGLRDAAKSLPGTLETFKMNVTDQQSVDEAVDFVKQRTTGLWALVNNAGIVGTSAADDWLDVAAYERAMAVNCFGVIRVTHAFKPLVKKRQGRVVNIASIAGRLAFPSTGPYNCSKFAVEAYSDTLRMELAPFNVGVHILEPGFFRTNLLNRDDLDGETKRVWDKLSDEVKEEYGHDYLKRMQDMRAEQMIGFSSDRIDYVTDAYYDAITSRYPKKRYHPGWDSIFFFIPTSMLPTCVQDYFYMNFFMWRGAPMPKVAKRTRVQFGF